MGTNVVLSFDDGRGDNYLVAKNILQEKNIPATFNITTDYVLEKDEAYRPCVNPPMTKRQVIELSQNGLFEIAGHGKKHHNEMSNLADGLAELQAWTHRECAGVASPNSKLAFDQVLSQKKEYHANNIHYVRLGDRFPRFALMKRTLRKTNSVLHSKAIYQWIYANSFVTPEDTFVLPSIPVMNHTTVKELVGAIENAVKKDESVIFMFHSVCRAGESFHDDPWTWDYGKFEKFCDALCGLRDGKKIRLCTTKELMKRR